MGNRERAERVILEILRQSGGGMGKTRLFKAFWLAHLFYARSEPGYLSGWPIVRMPNGPGIDRGDRLLQDLVDGGAIRKDHEQKGPYTEINCKLTDKAIEGELPPGAIRAIGEAVEYLAKHSAASISELSHDFSRSWNSTDNGQELSIYSDLIPDDVYEARKRDLAEMKKTYEDLFE